MGKIEDLFIFLLFNALYWTVLMYLFLTVSAINGEYFSFTGSDHLIAGVIFAIISAKDTVNHKKNHTVGG